MTSISESKPAPPSKRSKRHYTSRAKRNAKAFASFQLTERDFELLKALNRFKVLSIGLIWKLIFPENTSPQSAQRRVKILWHNGFIGRVTPFIKINEGSSSCAYYLDKKGREFLEAQGETIRAIVKNGEDIKWSALEHMLDVSKFGVFLELALKKLENPKLFLHKCIFDYETKSHIKEALDQNRFRLYQKVDHPVSKKSYVCYPDLLIVLKKMENELHPGKLIFVEIDRGTMGMESLREKLVGYNLYFEQEIYKKFGNFNGFTVLFQTSSLKRVEAIRNAFTDMKGTEMVLITDVQSVDENMLKNPIWLNSKYEKIALVKKKEAISQM